MDINTVVLISMINSVKIIIHPDFVTLLIFFLMSVIFFSLL